MFSRWIFSVFFLAVFSTPLSAVPPLLKKVLETNTVYVSKVSSRETWSGGSFIVSNHISRRGLNVGGKIVVAVTEAGRADIQPLTSFQTNDDAPDLKNFVEKLPENVAVMRTDLRGTALFSVSPKAGFGRVDNVRVKILFINQSGFFSEHQVVHEVRSLSPLRFAGALATPFALIFGIMVFIGQAWRQAKIKNSEFPEIYFFLFPQLVLLNPLPSDKKKGGKELFSKRFFQGQGVLTMFAAVTFGAAVFFNNPFYYAALILVVLFYARRIREAGPFTPLLAVLVLGVFASFSYFQGEFGTTDVFEKWILSFPGYPYILLMALLFFPAVPFFLPIIFLLYMSGDRPGTLLSHWQALVGLVLFVFIQLLFYWRIRQTESRKP